LTKNQLYYNLAHSRSETKFQNIGQNMPLITNPNEGPKKGPGIAYVVINYQGSLEDSQIFVFGENVKIPSSQAFGEGQVVKDYLISAGLSLRQSMTIFPGGIIPDFGSFNANTAKHMDQDEWHRRNQERINNEGWKLSLSRQWLLNGAHLQSLANHTGLPMVVYIHYDGDDGEPKFQYVITPDK
jgi:hypothetical protein